MGCDARGEVLINRPMRPDRADKPVRASVTRAENNPRRVRRKKRVNMLAPSRVSHVLSADYARSERTAHPGGDTCLQYVNSEERRDSQRILTLSSGASGGFIAPSLQSHIQD